MSFNLCWNLENPKNIDVGIPYVKLCDDDYRTESIIVNPGNIEHYSTCVDMKHVRVEFVFGKSRWLTPMLYSWMIHRH